jgi:hypothetical protein
MVNLFWGMNFNSIGVFFTGIRRYIFTIQVPKISNYFLTPDVDAQNAMEGALQRPSGNPNVMNPLKRDALSVYKTANRDMVLTFTGTEAAAVALEVAIQVYGDSMPYVLTTAKKSFGRNGTRTWRKLAKTKATNSSLKIIKNMPAVGKPGNPTGNNQHQRKGDSGKGLNQRGNSLESTTQSNLTARRLVSIDILLDICVGDGDYFG